MPEEKDLKRFESILKGLKIEVSEDNLTLKIDLPKTVIKEEAKYSLNSVKDKDIPMLIPEQFLDDNPSEDHSKKSFDNTSINGAYTGETIDIEEDEDINFNQEIKPKKNKDYIRAKIAFKAYIKIALHALKYAHPKEPRKNWVEVIGLMTGFIENEGKENVCINIQDAHPIGHGDAVTAQIQDPNSVVKVYNEKDKKHSILGWYHSHPSYSPFMSDTDYRTQYRYQKLAKGSILTQPIALVIDPTEISTKNFGFKIFRLKEDYKSWDEPKFDVIDTPVKTIPEMIETLLPLTVGKAVFLEYE